MTAGAPPAQRARTIRRAVFTGAVIIALFALTGPLILRAFGVTTDAFRIVGGLIFFGIGGDMLAGGRGREKTTPAEEAEPRPDPSIIPLGMPTLVGPGTISTVITLQAEATSFLHHLMIYLAIPVVMGVSWAVLRVAGPILQRTGQTGLNVMTRIMGLLIIVIGVQTILNAIDSIARGLLTPRG